MNALRLARPWTCPLTHPRHGTIRSITSKKTPPTPARQPLKFTKPTQKLSPKIREPLFHTPITPSSSKATLSPEQTSRVFQTSHPDHLPYQIVLSKSGNLPVYVKHRKDGTKELTYIRKIKGDHSALVKDLSEHLRIPRESIRIKQPAGFLEVKGERAKEIREFLRLKGFEESYSSTLIT